MKTFVRNLILVFVWFGVAHSVCMAAEFRGFWVDAFNAEFKNEQQIGKIITDVRSANANAILVQIRKRGDAYFDSRLEPKAIGIASDFDPLANFLTQAHNTNTGPRIEVHAWITAYPIWRGADGSPSQTNHPYLLHADWLDRNSRGDTFDGRDYYFDPGHPKVQEHIFNVAMEIVSNYDVDGLNLDYIHYPNRDWGDLTPIAGQIKSRVPPLV